MAHTSNHPAEVTWGQPLGRADRQMAARLSCYASVGAICRPLTSDVGLPMAAKNGRCIEDDLPCPGSVFFLPLSDGRFSIARVVRRVMGIDPTKSTIKRQVVSSRVLVVSSSWVGAEKVRPSHAKIRTCLVLTHHSWGGVTQATWISEPPPVEFSYAGLIPLSKEDDDIESVAYGDWKSLCLQPLLQWRWDHDRENLLLEEAVERKHAEEKRRHFSERQAEILPTLTLESLTRREWFEKWDADGEHSFRQESKLLILKLIEELDSLPKRSKSFVRNHLRQCVESFNQLDEAHSFIQTTHAEDIVEALELIVSVARYPGLVDSIDEWRAW